MATHGKFSTATPFLPARHTLPAIRAALPACEGCDLFRFATQAVAGAGSSRAKLLLVGEEPGDQEDLQGKPFVGPAGKLLDRALQQAGIDRKTVFVTNAVKHFKFVQRGKRRLHEKPRASEVNACRPWLLAEMDAVKPAVVVCLGASAAKSLLGAAFSLMRQHGKVLASPYAERVVATVHPSAILRAPDEEGRASLLRMLTDDLAIAKQAAAE